MDNENKQENKKNSNGVKGHKITPAYIRKKEDISKDKKIKKTLINKENKKKILVSALSIAVLLSIIIIINFVIRYNMFKPYRSFEENMNVYGFSKSYNNKTPKTSEKVTKSEAIKLVLATTLNTNDISGFAKESDEAYENSMWVEYAKYLGIIGDGEITKENQKDKATYIDVIRYFANAKTKILEKELDSNSNLKVKDIGRYKPDEQVAIEDMVSNQIININAKKINGKKSLFKGNLNELCINFALKYNTITLNDEKININEEKMPANKKDYPYTLSNIDKNVYEKSFYIDDKAAFKTPRELYAQKKDYYMQIQEIAEGYFNTTLNINYNTVDYDSLNEQLSEYSLYGTEGLEEYVEYVKENKIIIEGKSSVQFPTVYFDGVQYVIRMKLEFEIKNASTRYDLLYTDLLESNNSKSNIKYENDKYSIYIDAKMGDTLGGSDAIYINSIPVINLLLDSNVGIIRE